MYPSETAVKIQPSSNIMRNTIFLLIVLPLGLSAQTFRTLSDNEIESCETPQAVAWNFVESILGQDYARMESLTDSLTLHLVKTKMENMHFSSYEQLFLYYLDGILDVRKQMTKGWSLVCDEGSYQDLSNLSVDESYQSLRACSVTFDLMKKGKSYSQKRNCGAAVRVTVIQKDGKWRVLNFK